MLACALWLFATMTAGAKPQTPASSVQMVLLSDFHFDPFYDPAKLAELRSAPPQAWAKILNTPFSEDRAASFNALQEACHVRGVDTSWPLLKASLRAAHAQQPKPLGVLVSGDLLVHEFACRLKTLAPESTERDLSDLAQKTVEFVTLQLRQAFPAVPVYMALGNNDTGCDDYRESAGSRFLQSAGENFSAATRDGKNRLAVLQEFSKLGDYAVQFPAPLLHTRLIVLQDVFESRHYATCAGKPDPVAATDQIVWLRAQLIAARQQHEQVWVMAHIPPGIDVYSSFHSYVLKPAQLCDVTAPKPLLSSAALSDTLTDFADVVRLAVFAHTHEDEMKLLHGEAGNYVAGKLVPSVSPINGNYPSFTVAQVDRRTGTMLDYSVFTAQDLGGSKWARAYSFREMYGMPDYSADSVRKLTTKLAADATGDSELSQKYRRWFLPGDIGIYALGLRQIWPAYACAIIEDGGPAFHQCMCPAEAPPK